MPPNFGLGTNLQGRTLGIWGYGQIGKLVAGDGRAFGMRVLIWGRAPSRDSEILNSFEVASTRDGLFEQSDVLSLHLRLNKETTGIASMNDLSKMKPSALLVNISRAELIQPEALLSAPNRRRPWHGDSGCV